MTPPRIEEAEFERRADEALAHLQSALDELPIDAEIELQMGILSIEFSDGTKYVINSHRAAKQIWMAAERSAWHFDPGDDGRWTASKTGDEMNEALERVLSKKLGKEIRLSSK